MVPKIISWPSLLTSKVTDASKKMFIKKPDETKKCRCIKIIIYDSSQTNPMEEKILRKRYIWPKRNSENNQHNIFFSQLRFSNSRRFKGGILNYACMPKFQFNNLSPRDNICKIMNFHACLGNSTGYPKLTLPFIYQPYVAFVT